MGYLLPVLNTALSSDTAAVAALEVGKENNSHSIGETTNAVAAMCGGNAGQLDVLGGYVYVLSHLPPCWVRAPNTCSTTGTVTGTPGVGPLLRFRQRSVAVRPFVDPVTVSLFLAEP
ncbi:MAG: hypothetical protein M0003_08095 [Acidithiobacillus sp.]|nr:hypothetical protein [Acidithiobacillus sp.]